MPRKNHGQDAHATKDHGQDGHVTGEPGEERNRRAGPLRDFRFKVQIAKGGGKRGRA
jgi:hypothetical protein